MSDGAREDFGDAATGRQLFADLAARHGLTWSWEEIEGDLVYDFPKQPGLDFQLWFSLFEDDLSFGGEGWWAEHFGLNTAEGWRDFSAVAEGLITGEVRILLYHALGRKKPYWTSLQHRREGTWRHVSSGIGCAVPPVFRRTIRRNGHPDRVTGPRPAWMSIIALSLLGYAVYAMAT